VAQDSALPVLQSLAKMSQLPRDIHCLSCAKAFIDDLKLNQHLGKSHRCRRFYDIQSTQCVTSAPVPILAASASSKVSNHANDEWIADLPGYTPFPRSPSPNPDPRLSKCPQVMIEEVEDKDTNLHWEYKSFPGAAQSFGQGMTTFRDVYDEQASMNQQPYEPFMDRDEWELAKWLMVDTKQSAIDKFLKLPIVSISKSIVYF